MPGTGAMEGSSPAEERGPGEGRSGDGDVSFSLLPSSSLLLGPPINKMGLKPPWQGDPRDRRAQASKT